MKNKIIISLMVLLLICCSNSRTIKYGFPQDSVPGTITHTRLGSYYLPSTYSPEKKFTLIVILHGLGQHESLFLQRYEWIKEAEKRDYIICSVKSKREYWSNEPGSPDVENIHTMIRIIEKKFSVREDKVCLFGWSSGGGFVNVMVLYNRPFWKKDLYIDAFISGSGASSFEMDGWIRKGHIPERLKAPVLFFWGEKEVPPLGKALSQFLINQGWDVTTHPHPGLHYIPIGGIGRSFDWLDSKIP